MLKLLLAPTLLLGAVLWSSLSFAQSSGFLPAVEGAYAVSPAQIASLDSTGVAVDAAFSRFVIKSKVNSYSGGSVFKTNALGVRPYLTFEALPIVVGLPVSYNVQKTSYLTADDPEETLESTVIGPQVALKLGPASLGLQYENRKDRGEWNVHSDRTKDYDMTASRTHVGAMVNLGRGEVGLAYANRVSIRKEVSETYTTENGFGTSSTDVSIDIAARTSLHGRLTLSKTLALGAVVDYTPLTSEDTTAVLGKKKPGLEDRLGVRPILFLAPTANLKINPSLTYYGPGRVDLEEGTGLTHSYGAQVDSEIRLLRSWVLGATVSYREGARRIRYDDDAYDDDGNKVGQTTTEVRTKTTHAAYKLSVGYCF